MSVDNEKEVEKIEYAEVKERIKPGTATQISYNNGEYTKIQRDNIPTFEEYFGNEDVQDKNLTLDEISEKYYDIESKLFEEYTKIENDIQRNSDKQEVEKLNQQLSELEEKLEETRDKLSKLIPLEVVDNYEYNWDNVESDLVGYFNQQQFEDLKEPVYLNRQTGQIVHLSEGELKLRENKMNLGLKELENKECFPDKETRINLNDYEQKEEIVKLSKRLEQVLKTNIEKDDNTITNAIIHEFKDALDQGMDAENIDTSLKYALQNVRIHMKVKGIDVSSSLATDPKNIQISNGAGMKLINTRVDKIQINPQDEILLENRRKLLSCIEDAQLLTTWVKNYETILNTEVSDRRKVYNELGLKDVAPSSIKKEAINIVMKKEMAKNESREESIDKQPIKNKGIWQRLGFTKKKNNVVKINLASTVSYATSDDKSALKKVHDLKRMSDVVDSLNNDYLKNSSKDIKNITVVYNGEDTYKVQIINKNGHKNILDVKTKDGNIYFKTSEVQKELTNIKPIKRYDLSDQVSIKKDLTKLQDGLEIALAKVEISKDVAAISEFRHMQNELFKDGMLNDAYATKIINQGIDLKKDMTNNIDNYEELLLRGDERIVTTGLEDSLHNNKLKLQDGFPKELIFQDEPVFGDAKEQKMVDIQQEDKVEIEPQKADLKIRKSSLEFTDDDIANFKATQKFLEMAETKDVSKGMLKPLSEEKENQKRESMNLHDKTKDSKQRDRE